MDRFVKATSATVRNLWFVVAILLFFGVVSLVATVQAARSDAQRAEEQRNLILDCTSPSGECFQRGQEQQANAVADINLVTVYSIVCGERFDTERAIFDCVAAELEAHEKEEKK